MFSDRLIFYALVIAVSVVAGIIGYILKRRRDKHVGDVLKDMGLKAVNPNEDDLLAELCDFTFLKLGQKRRYRKAYRGEVDAIEVIVFDYEIGKIVQQGLEKEVEWQEQTVAGFRIPGMSLKRLNEKKPSGFQIQGKGDHIIFFNEGVLLPPNGYESFISRCLKSLERIRSTDVSS